MVWAATGRPGKAWIGVALTTAASFCLAALPVGAGVRSSTEVRAYTVGGTSAASLVSYMKTRPFPGDHGAAVANIRPKYSLTVLTKDEGKDGICRATKVDLSVRFVMTLPKAKSEGSLAPGTRNAWKSFVSFARKHEETHRSIYLGCANGFVSKALRMTSKTGCFALQANIKKLLEAEKKACERKHNAFDRGEYRRVFGLSLFKMAKYSSRKPAKVSQKKPAGSRSILAPSN